MSRFNPVKKTKTISNYEGAPAFEMTPERELYSLVSTTFFDDKFYRSASDEMDRLLTLSEKVDLEFLQGLPIYCRTEMGLRSVSMALLTALARRKGLTRKIVFRSVQRADELTEAFAVWQYIENKDNIREAPMSLKRGIKDALNKFNPYQIAKYHRGGGREITLKNVLEILHPKPVNPKQSKLFKDIINESLPKAERWETEISATQGDEKKRSESWEKLILEDKLGYMALLRNLRNIIDANVSKKAMKRVIDRIQDPEAVRNSKQFPFRFLSAYRQIRYGSPKKLCTALENAVLHTANNVPGLTEFCQGKKILVAADVSASMGVWLSGRSKVTLSQAALMLAKLLYTSADEATFGTFSTKWEVLPHRNDILAHCHDIQMGGGTYGHLVVDWALRSKKKFDAICFFTDMQLYSRGNYMTTSEIQESWNKYVRLVAPECKMYIFDIAGYGHAPINFVRPDVMEVAGWSEKIFKYVSDMTNRDLEKIIASYAK